jgi:flagellar biosynthesis chaperone FliJ
MDSTELFDDGFAQARREESRAHNEMDYYQRVAKGQQIQMEVLLQHKTECVKGIANAKKTGLPPAHVKEFKLLMDHIDLTVETLSYKVDKSHADYEKSKEVWLKKNKVFVDIKEEIKQKALEQEGEFTDFNENNERSGKDVFGHKSINSAKG